MLPEIPGYKIVRELGQGGMAVVYLAVQELFERLVALKVMRPASSADQEFAQRFVREARIIGHLNHPNIVPVYEVGDRQGQFFFSMEFVPDGDLTARIEKGLGLEQVIHIMGQLARALDYAHRHGVIHRDVKPDNILFRTTGEAVLTDFGVATDLNDSGRLTIVESVIGSPRYMSPEQIRGASVDSRSDIFSLGLVMYEMVTGHYPFDGTNTGAIALQHLEKIPLTLPSKANILQPLLNRMTTLAASDRFPTALALADELDRLGVGAGLDSTRGFKADAADRVGDKPTIVVDRKEAELLRKQFRKPRPWWRTMLTRRWFTPAWIVFGIISLSLIVVLARGYYLQDKNAGSNSSHRSSPSTASEAGSPDQQSNPQDSERSGSAILPGYYLFERGNPSRTPFQQTTRQQILMPTADEVYLYSDVAAGVSEISVKEYSVRYPKSVFTEILMIKEGDEQLLANVLYRARAGEEAAQLILSELTDSGWGVAENPQEALALARQAARFDYPLGHYQVATILMQTDGKGEQEALLHLQKAAEAGLFLAMTTLADIYSNQGGTGGQDRALKLYRAAAELGDREAMFKAGKILLGEQSTSGSTFEALTYLRRAAAKGQEGADLLLQQVTQESDGLPMTN